MHPDHRPLPSALLLSGALALLAAAGFLEVSAANAHAESLAATASPVHVRAVDVALLTSADDVPATAPGGVTPCAPRSCQTRA